jgi:acetoin utilization protein AcuB
MLMPTIERYMTSQPWTTTSDAALLHARRLMETHHIRHLPVVDDGRLVGIVTDRDLRYAETLPAKNGQPLTVEDAMIGEVFTVGTGTPSDEVVEQMAARKCGSAVVMGGDGEVVGIFTANDALQFFAEVLRRACG